MIQLTHKELAGLVRQAQAKNSDAFARLYEATYQQLYYYVLSLVRNRQDAEDLVQSIYIIVLKKLDTLKEGGTFIAWLNHIAYNECMHLLAARKKTPAGELYEDEAASLPDTDAGSDPLLQSVKSDRERRVMAAMDTLAPEHKTVLLMQYYHAMKLQDIAIVLGCPVGTVKSRANAAKQQLKKALAGQEELRFNMFIPIFSVSGALKHSATGVSMPNMAARQGLQAALAEAGMSTNVSFTPRPNAVPPASPRTVATAGAATGVAAVAAVGAAVVMLAAPSIVSATYDMTPARSTTIVIEAKDLRAEESVFVTAPDGTRYEAVSEGNGTYLADATENGLYTVEAFGRGDKTATATVEVNSLDYLAPTVTEYHWEGDLLTLHLADEGVGVSYADVRAGGEEGDFAPVEIDEAAGTVVFPLSENDFYVSVADKLGNATTYKVTVS